MAAYYNEIEPIAVEWLKNLIKGGYIASGDVDERSIVDVRKDDLKGYTQCHFFAGIGGWSLALRLAGWDDERPVWTGGCPCQPFSLIGKQKGRSDERHLWPIWSKLIKQSEPSIIFGEQVENAVACGWLDEVFDDLEGNGYSCGAAIIPACSVNSPQKRHRLFFVADSMQKSAWNGRKSGMQNSQEDTWEGLVLPPRSSVVDGVSENVAIIGAYGNAIVPQVAAEFIKCIN